MSTLSYTEARESLASVWDETVSTREPVIISRRGSESVVLLPLDEWRGLVGTVHLLRSPENARRLLAALQRLDAGQGAEHTPQSGRWHRVAKAFENHIDDKRDWHDSVSLSPGPPASPTVNRRRVHAQPEVLGA